MNKVLLFGLLTIIIFTSLISAASYGSLFPNSSKNNSKDQTKAPTAAAIKDLGVGIDPIKLESGDTVSPTIKDESSADERERNWSREDICNFVNGCMLDGECYQFGYIINNTYCWDKVRISKYSSRTINDFENQSINGNNCTYDFQCLSNFCFNKRCIDDLNNLFDISINNINNNSNYSTLNLSVEDIDLINDNISINNSETVIKENNDTEIIPKSIIESNQNDTNIFRKILKLLNRNKQ